MWERGRLPHPNSALSSSLAPVDFCQPGADGKKGGQSFDLGRWLLRTRRLSAGLCLALLLASLFAVTVAHSSLDNNAKDENAKLISGTAFLRRTLSMKDLGPAGLFTAPANETVGGRLSPASPLHSSSPATGGHSAPLANIDTSSSARAGGGFDGLNQQQGGNYIPPDVQVAAGPNDLVELVNNAGGVFSKNGTSISTFDLGVFFGTGNDYTGDPRVVFDGSSGRWFMSIYQADSLKLVTKSSVDLAVSTTNDPTGNWTIYTLVTSPDFPDAPIIGVSDDKLVASANDFSSNTTRFLGAQYWILNKNEMITAAKTIDFQSVGPDPSRESIYPADSLSSTMTQYLVTVGAGDIANNSTSVQLLLITGLPPGNVTVSSASLVVPAISQPPPGVQPGTNSTINPNDFRVLSAVWYQGNLWYSLNDACAPTGDTQTRSCARLTEINTNTPGVIQDMDLGAPGQYYFYPALSVDGMGNLDIVYGYSSSTIYPSLAVTGQAAARSGGALAPTQVLVQGTAADTSSSLAPPFGRYGDYFGAAVDPSNSSLVWVGGEYHSSAGGICLSGSCWSTFIDSVTLLNTHDVAVTSVVASRNFAYNGVASFPIKVNATVANFGASSENVTVSAYYNSTQIGGSSGGQNVTLAAGASAVVTFNWYANFTGVGNYTISGLASPVAGEKNLANNNLAMSGMFQVRKGGDVDGDGAVDIGDLILVWRNQFTTSLPSPYDINNDGAVDITDLIITWQHQFT